MKSSLKNMVVSLFLITMISSAVVGLAYRVTMGPIEEAKKVKIAESIGLVLPEFNNNPADERSVYEVDGGEIVVYTARKNDEVVGYAVESFSQIGFSGNITIMVGITAQGAIYKIETIGHSETPGLGDKIEGSKSDFSLQFHGKNPRQFSLKVTKDGGDVDAISAATISSRAYTDAVQRAWGVYQTLK